MSVFVDTLSGHKPTVPPVWLMRQAGRYLPEYMKVRQTKPNFLDLCYDPEAATEVTMQPIRRFDLDAAILFSDILVVPDALGQTVQFVKSEGPKLDAWNHETTLTPFDPNSFDTHLKPVYETVSSIRSALDISKSLIGFAGSPWTIACYMVNGEGSRDFAKVRECALTHAEWFTSLIQLITEATSHYLIQQIKHGANAIQLFDSWSGVLSNAEFDQWVIEPTKKIVSAINASYPDIPIIGFPRGAGYRYGNYAHDTGVTAISVDSMTPLSSVIRDLPVTMPVQGNFDPMLLAYQPEKIQEELIQMKESLAGRPYIVNLGHGIIPSTPPEHVSKLIEWVRS